MRNTPGPGVAGRLVWPTITAGVMLTMTLGLGFWQVDRLAWKTALLAEIERGEAGAPIPLPSQPKPFRRVVVEGEFLPGAARYGIEVRAVASGPVMGAQLISGLARPGGEPVLVDRGWAPLDFDPAPPAGPQRIEGYVRAPEPATLLGVKDDPVGRRFYALDPGPIGASLGLVHTAPFTVVALGSSDSLPQPARRLPRPPNDHLSYAATWFGLSAALIVIFALFVRQTLRREHSP